MSKPKKRSIDDEINELFGGKSSVLESDDENEVTRAKVVDFYEDDDSDEGVVKHSKLRSQNFQTLSEVDKRYAGKKVSRKDIYGDFSDEESDKSENDSNFENEATSELDQEMSDNDDDDDNEISDENKEENSENEDEENSENEQDDSENDQDDDDSVNSDEEDSENEEKSGSRNFRCMSDTNLKEKVQQGECVKQQLKLWENFVEMRIKFQKCLVTSNQLPQYDVYKNYAEDENFSKEVKETTKNVNKLLDNLLDLQSLLSKKRKVDEIEEDDDEEIASDTEDKEENAKIEENGENDENKKPRKKRKLEDYENILAQNQKSYKEHRNNIIHQWNDRTRVTISKSNKTPIQPILEQINFILSSKSKLVKKTQLKRSEYKIIGKNSATEDEDGRRISEYDEEIFDDDDFYHQLLRELIEAKSAGITDSVQMSRQWIQMQNYRNKVKKKIDTRATKGRRIRYNVMPKLVNSMPPIGIKDLWADTAKNELYVSLFGQANDKQVAK